ncbi:MAG: hypothetical protein J6A15_03595 [Clostridia bacterium]|nr:hypothetical protein [Clostridia bacterium]
MININLNVNHIITDGKEIKVLDNEINIFGGNYCIIYDSLPITIFLTEDVSIRKLYRILKKRFKIKL